MVGSGCGWRVLGFLSPCTIYLGCSQAPEKKVPSGAAVRLSSLLVQSLYNSSVFESNQRVFLLFVWREPAKTIQEAITAKHSIANHNERFIWHIFRGSMPLWWRSLQEELRWGPSDSSKTDVAGFHTRAKPSLFLKCCAFGISCKNCRHKRAVGWKAVQHVPTKIRQVARCLLG